MYWSFIFGYMMLYSSFSSWITQFLACMGSIGVYASHLRAKCCRLVRVPSIMLCLGIWKGCWLCYCKTQANSAEYVLQNRSCFGCCVKSQPIIAVDEPSKGLRIQGQAVKKPSISDGFWSTSTCDLENSAIQSQRSFSSISIPNSSLSQLSGTGSASNHSEFVNQGLLLWNQSRVQWLGTGKSQKQGKVKEPVLSWNASYENLLGTSKRFPQPVPLSEMVDFLVDIWDQEGMYD